MASGAEQLDCKMFGAVGLQAYINAHPLLYRYMVLCGIPMANETLAPLVPMALQVNLCTGLTGLAVDLNTTCTAGAGTLTLELGILSRLLGDPTYENMARRAVRTLWDMRHPHTGLVG